MQREYMGVRASEAFGLSGVMPHFANPDSFYSPLRGKCLYVEHLTMDDLSASPPQDKNKPRASVKLQALSVSDMIACHLHSMNEHHSMCI
eukprot:5874374-Amphidinium_carterae.1